MSLPHLYTSPALRRFPNWRRRFRSAFFPKGLVMDAWKAKVGKSRVSSWTQRRVTQVGTKSTLLISNTMCLCCLLLRSSPEFQVKGTILGKGSPRRTRRKEALLGGRLSSCWQRVPMGSLASSTKTRTSAASTTCAWQSKRSEK